MHERTAERLPEQYLLCDQLRLRGQRLLQYGMYGKQLHDELRLYRPLFAPGLQSPHDMHERTTERLPEQYLLCGQLRLRGQRLLQYGKQLHNELQLHRPLSASGLQSPHDMHERTTERLPEQWLLHDELRLRGQRLLQYGMYGKQLRDELRLHRPLSASGL